MIHRVFLLTMSTLVLMVGFSFPDMRIAAAVTQEASPAEDASPAQDDETATPETATPKNANPESETPAPETPTPKNPHAIEGSNPFGESNPLSKATPFIIAADGKPYELNEEAKQAKAKYDAAKQKLVEATTEMRVIHTLYMNGEDQSPEAFERFRESRSKTRVILDEVFDTAYEYLLLAPDEEPIQYLLTMLEHRYKTSDYSPSTMTASALLIDLGFNSRFLFHSAARASICSGEFETAKRIYAYLKPEDFDDLDKRLSYQLEEIQQQWLVEQQLREQDAKKDLPRVKMKTTRGDIIIELFLEEAPSTVSHFIKLTEEGYYDGLDFYQVVDNLLALTGDESGSGGGNTGQYLIDEHQRDGARNAFRGSLAMAKLPKNDSGDFVENSASSQFAIFFTPLPGVSKVQTVFGRVIEGMEFLTELRRVDPSKEKKQGEVVFPPDRVIAAEVIRRPDELPEPVYRK